VATLSGATHSIPIFDSKCRRGSLGAGVSSARGGASVAGVFTANFRLREFSTVTASAGAAASAAAAYGRSWPARSKASRFDSPGMRTTIILPSKKAYSTSGNSLSQSSTKLLSYTSSRTAVRFEQNEPEGSTANGSNLGTLVSLRLIAAGATSPTVPDTGIAPLDRWTNFGEHATTTTETYRRRLTS